jgi:hypothetical protein
MYCVLLHHSDQTLSLPFIEGWFCFCEFYFSGSARIKGKYSFFLLHQKYSHSNILNINLQIYRIIDFSPLATNANSDGKRYLIASKLEPCETDLL